MVVDSAVSANVPVRRSGDRSAAGVHSAAETVGSRTDPSTTVEGVAVIKRSALGEVPAAVINRVSATPIESPMTPTPPKAAVPTDSEAESEAEVRAAKPDSGIWIPSRPRHDGTSVNQPGIIGGDVNDIGISRLNGDVIVLTARIYGLLRRGLKIARCTRASAHHLHRIHHILLLVVVGVA